MSTSLRLSHLLTFTDAERLAHVRDAQRYGKLAMEHAIRSQNAGRVAQMRFYLVCVAAREVSLLCERENQSESDRETSNPKPNQRSEAGVAAASTSKREETLAELSAALSELEAMDDLVDVGVYEAMAREYSESLM